MLDDDYKNCVGYIKYEGDPVMDGFLDARKSAEILLGLDESIRFFITKGETSINFEIPVRIRKGSWEVLVPDLLIIGAGTVATAYLSSAAAELAHNDFKDATTGKLVRGAIKKIQSVIKITKHIGTRISSEIKTRVKNYNNIEIENPTGQVLTVSKDEFTTFMDRPENILSKLTSAVDKNLTLKVASIESGKVTEEEVTDREKDLFFNAPIPEEELFPELKDGAIVEIEGKITKGNERTNALGVEYKGHILNCHPERGGVIKYKKFLFTKCRVRGVVDRRSAQRLDDKKPQIVITDMVGLEDSDATSTLFNQ